jgi:hypothetical protein
MENRKAEKSVWYGMKERCFNANSKAFKYYGGRGITVCPEWREDFDSFYRDMGPRPSDMHTIDRINNDGNYEPGNCIWASKAAQANNRSNNTVIEIEGRTQPMTQWARESGVNRTVILKRMKRGLTGAPLIKKGILK